MSEFKGTIKKVYALQFGSVMFIQDDDFYEANNILDIEDVGLEKVEANANLIVDAFKVRQQINCELSELLEEFNQLKKWKEEATTVFSKTDFQKIGTILNIKLGTSIHEHLLPKIIELKEQHDEMLAMLEELLMDIDEITIPTSMNKSIFNAEQLIKKVKDNE